MKQHHLYSIGNALVDVDFKIQPHQLTHLGIEKGVMTLIDEARCQTMLKQFSPHTQAKTCAGSAVNTTILLSQLGGSAFYSGRIGNDELGDVFCDELKKQSVATNIPIKNRQQGATGTCLVMVTPDTDRTMNTYLGVAASFSQKDLDEEAIAKSEYFYIEGYLVASDIAFDAILAGCDIAKQHNTKITLTLSDRNLVKAFKHRFDEILAKGVHLLFANELEAKAFVGIHNLKQASEALKSHVEHFVITLGPNGALLCNSGQLIDSAAYDVSTLDAVGAGDTFAGSFIYSLAHGFNFEEAGDIANFASALVVARYGSRLDNKEIDKVKHFIEEKRKTRHNLKESATN